MKKTLVSLSFIAAFSLTAHAAPSSHKQLDENYLHGGIVNLKVDLPEQHLALPGGLLSISEMDLTGFNLGIANQWRNGVYATFDYTNATDELGFSRSGIEFEAEIYNAMIGKQYALNNEDLIFVELGGYARKMEVTVRDDGMTGRADEKDENFVARVGYKRDFGGGFVGKVALEHEESETLVAGEVQWSLSKKFAVAAYAGANTDENRYGLEVRYFPQF